MAAFALVIYSKNYVMAMVQLDITLYSPDLASSKCSCLSLQLAAHEELANRIVGNARQYVNLFAEAADELMPEPTVPASELDEDVYDVLMRHRQEQFQENTATGDAAVSMSDPMYQLPAVLRRR